jgi:hypothetical protein
MVVRQHETATRALPAGPRDAGRRLAQPRLRQDQRKLELTDALRSVNEQQVMVARGRQRGAQRVALPW